MKKLIKTFTAITLLVSILIYLFISALHFTTCLKECYHSDTYQIILFIGQAIIATLMICVFIAICAGIGWIIYWSIKTINNYSKN